MLDPNYTGQEVKAASKPLLKDDGTPLAGGAVLQLQWAVRKSSGGSLRRANIQEEAGKPLALIKMGSFQGGSFKVQMGAQAPSQQSQVGILVVKCERAEGLAKMDTFTGKADPYLVLEVDGERKTTKPQKKTLTPEWNETLTFDCIAGSSVLKVEVFDHEMVGKHRSMGVATCPIQPIMSQNAFDLTGKVNLTGPPATGTVFLSLTFEPK